MTLVSIVTPSYNQSAFLEETILSVLQQEDVDIEHIIIDGGSTDGSLDIIKKYAGRLAWWVSERDSGQADAINKGLRRATGEYIAWLNSDDLYMPGAVAQADAALGSNPEVGFVFGDAITIDTQGRKLNDLTFGDWGLEELMAFRIICQPAVFMRRSVLEKTDYLDTTYHYMLDHQLWLRLARIAPIQHIPSTWAAARHHPDAKNVAQPAGFSGGNGGLCRAGREFLCQNLHVSRLYPPLERSPDGGTGEHNRCSGRHPICADVQIAAKADATSEGAPGVARIDRRVGDGDQRSAVAPDSFFR